jgi:hypothetical protein
MDFAALCKEEEAWRSLVDEKGFGRVKWLIQMWRYRMGFDFMNTVFELSGSVLISLNLRESVLFLL